MPLGAMFGGSSRSAPPQRGIQFAGLLCRSVIEAPATDRYVERHDGLFGGVGYERICT